VALYKHVKEFPALYSRVPTMMCQNALKRGFRVLGFTLHFASGLCPDCEMKLYLIS
jgi:hypothetical protein